MDLVGLLKSQFLCHLVFCYVFIASGLIVNTIQLLTLLLWPINKQLFRKINCRLSYCVSSQLVLLLEWWSGTECVIYTDPQAYPKYGKENAIVVLNHKFEIDFLCGWSLAERFGVLGGSKVLAKKELAYVPIIGWMWYFTEMVFCTRKWEQDRKTVSKSLLHLRDYPEKYFFLIHCEGTRFTEKKHQISMQVAQAKGLPSLKHHLLPRTKGFAVTVRSLRNVDSSSASFLPLHPRAAPYCHRAACITTSNPHSTWGKGRVRGSRRPRSLQNQGPARRGRLHAPSALPRHPKGTGPQRATSCLSAGLFVSGSTPKTRTRLSVSSLPPHT
ncbi:1-acyl-sn-glycerol-3-phosphate acyltransferase delta isoform X4 [Camelus dromedarius]|uniref:1-acyl-sn-glycerol-3-phosphate acyltransferase delta isoform X4 n=1 Tax=Camelus dromedarius TaxID=9838 RepID=UPI00311A35F0